MDIDDFKSFNDDYGHQYGDKILQKVGEKLRGAFRGTDIVGRIGGDEFIVFLEEISSREAIIRKAREVCGMFRKVGDEIGSPREITGSVGVACCPDDGLSFDSLLAKADQALYHAKKCGKNQFSFSTDLSNR
ncbi:GGDEF domain-containing protein [[Clostridium] leptum]|uniref:GGDEF domain-containing protein n=1 Tax=[Clostridium] leptum TaxID=1535 RepID=A0A412AVN1_9FIRM|nr:GGDEF domain-containing protein [[Clostridium] leptum]